MQPADIRRLLDAFENSDWNEISLSVDGIEVFISAEEASGDRAATVAPVTQSEPARSAAAVAAPEAETPATPPAAQERPQGTPVKAPSPGIFWRSPSPGAPPFVEIGQRVDANSVIGIVEVMKLMNPVSAGVSGSVVAIAVDNGGKVTGGQALVIIDTDT